MSEYDDEFIYAYETERKPSIRERLSQKASALTVGATIAVGAVVGAAVGAGTGIVLYSYVTSPAPVVVNNQESVTWITGAATTASPSVVTVAVSGSSSGGNGSGEFLTEDGYVMTNAHVVTLDGSTSKVTLQVKTYDGHIYPATVVGTDPINDIAVIKVQAPVKFKPITFADSSKINVGDRVVAIGAPLGLANTVTEGIVSALNRTIQVASSAVPDNSGQGGGLQLFSGTGTAVNLRVIQTDAAINPGNSGGALVNERGELVGVNVAIASAGSSSAAGSIGVGFAIPANVAHRVANEIIKTGKASHGLLGAGVIDAAKSSETASFTIGAQVKELTKGGAAEKGGIKVGDIVTKFNGQTITTAGELTAAVRQEQAGASAEIVVTRDGKEIVLNVILGDASSLK